MRRRLSLSTSLLCWALLGLGGLAPPLLAGVVRLEFGGGLVGTIIGVIGGLFGIGGGRGAPFWVTSSLQALGDGLTKVGEALANFIKETAKFFALMAGSLVRLWRSGLQPLLTWLRARLLALRGWLLRVFGPILRMIARLRKEWLQFYTRFVRPVLDVIQFIRFALQTLGRLGVEWAKAVDVKLEQLESTLTENFLAGLERLNAATDILNSVITGALLFQRLPFLRTLRRDLVFANRLWWSSQASRMSATERDRRGRLLEPPTVDELVSDTRASVLGGGLTPLLDETLHDVRLALGLRSG